jgi:hypothetical protein
MIMKRSRREPGWVGHTMIVSSFGRYLPGTAHDHEMASWAGTFS